MIITQNIFPVTIAKTVWQDSHLLGEEFDNAIDQVLSQQRDPQKLQPTIESTFRMTNDVFEWEITRPLKYWVQSVMKDLWESIGYEPADIAVERSWINRVPKGAFLSGHAHGSTEMVATYYHKAPPGSAKLVLYNPFEQTGMSPYKQKEYVIEPKSGELYAWPGYLWHRVEPHELSDPRIAISMHIHQGSFTVADRWTRFQ